LLKLHGSVCQLSEKSSDGTTTHDIVITRDDYMALPSRHAALIGLVQAMLLTRHMLFVGYGLGDEDFHRIVHDVRAAVSASGEGTASNIGSALVLQRDELQETLWQDTIDTIAVNDGKKGDDAEAARTLQILLDRVVYLTSDLTAFVLDDGFRGLLTEAEKEVAGALSGLPDLIDSDEDPELAVTIEELLKRWGWSRPSEGLPD
jgi:hypothetical protein